MNKQETAIILKTIKTAYPLFEITAEVTRLWHESMLGISYETGQKNLRQHIISSKYVPTIAEIVRHDPEVNVNYKQMHLDTQSYLQHLEERQRLSIACPSHLRQTYLKSEVDSDV